MVTYEIWVSLLVYTGCTPWLWLNLSVHITPWKHRSLWWPILLDSIFICSLKLLFNNLIYLCQINLVKLYLLNHVDNEIFSFCIYFHSSVISGVRHFSTIKSFKKHLFWRQIFNFSVRNISPCYSVIIYAWYYLVVYMLETGSKNNFKWRNINH